MATTKDMTHDEELAEAGEANAAHTVEVHLAASGSR